MDRKGTTCTHEILPFDTDFGDKLDIIKINDKAYISIVSVCAVLGSTRQGQHAKLKRAAWASGKLEMIEAPDAQGKLHNQMFVDIDCLPMWMATMKIGHIAEPLRPKLRWFQERARDVLARAFLPASVRNVKDAQPDVTVNVDGGITRGMWTDLLAKLDSWTHWSRKVEDQVHVAGTAANEAAQDAERALTAAAHSVEKVRRLEAQAEEDRKALATLAADLTRTRETLADLLVEIRGRKPAGKRWYKSPLFSDFWDKLYG